MTASTNAKPEILFSVRAQRGSTLRCKGWKQETILRMLENNMEVAEHPEQLVIYGGIGKAARNWESYHAIVQALKDLDALSMADMKKQIERQRALPDYDKKQVSNLEFGLWNKIALPLAALVFGLVGAPLGIRNHRAGTATGFALSVVIIFGYMMLSNAMSIMAQGGRIPAYMASFTPIVIGLAVAIVLIQRRN